jgi:branched-chain amino acid transport system permease protein
VAAVAGAALGAVVALPALRLRGLELALSTLAFGQLAYYMFFLQPQVMGRSDLIIPRLHLPGISLAGGDANLVFLTVVFALLSAGVLGIRRSRFGRILVASKDSQAAVATLGLNLRLAKVLLFSLATALATFGGALYGSTQQIVTSDNFQYVSSLFIVLIVYVFGVATPGAALAGGLSLAVAPLIAVHIPVRFQAITYFMTGFGALVLLNRPEGVIPAASGWVHEKLRPPAVLGARRSSPSATPAPSVANPAVTDTFVTDMEVGRAAPADA